MGQCRASKNSTAGRPIPVISIGWGRTHPRYTWKWINPTAAHPLPKAKFVLPGAERYRLEIAQYRTDILWNWIGTAAFSAHRQLNEGLPHGNSSADSWPAFQVLYGLIAPAG